MKSKNKNLSKTSPSKEDDIFRYLVCNDIYNIHTNKKIHLSEDGESIISSHPHEVYCALYNVYYDIQYTEESTEIVFNGCLPALRNRNTNVGWELNY